MIKYITSFFSCVFVFVLWWPLVTEGKVTWAENMLPTIFAFLFMVSFWIALFRSRSFEISLNKPSLGPILVFLIGLLFLTGILVFTHHDSIVFYNEQKTKQEKQLSEISKRDFDFEFDQSVRKKFLEDERKLVIEKKNVIAEYDHEIRSRTSVRLISGILFLALFFCAGFIAKTSFFSSTAREK